MQDKLLQQKNKIIIGVVVLVILGAGYFFYNSSTSDSLAASEVDIKLFNAEVRNFYVVRNSINLDDSFMKGKNEDFYRNLKSYYKPMPLKEPEGTSKGRTNPFVPYVAP